MAIGLIGKKCGMTRIFTEEGVSIPVTVIEIKPNRVTQVKTEQVDGYSAVQITTGSRRASRVTKPQAGHFAKAGVEPGQIVSEFRVDAPALESYVLGAELAAADIFTAGQLVDVTGISKGKGFAGTIKRHNFTMGDATHGNSRSHRVPGSIGQRQTPGRVFKGKKMCGHMGNKQCTLQNQQIIQVDVENNILLVKGGIPGAPGGFVVVLPAVKSAITSGEAK